MEVVKKVSDENDLMFRTVNEEQYIIKSKKPWRKKFTNSPNPNQLGSRSRQRTGKEDKAISLLTPPIEVWKAGYDPTIDNQGNTCRKKASH